MPSLIGPSHHIYYAALHRRRLWLAHLADAFASTAKPAWAEERGRLDRSFARTLGRLSAEEHLGIQHPLPLGRVLDDTPIDSFLTTLAEELDAYESNLIELMRGARPAAAWPECEATLENVSLLWGRELAQESRIALAKADAHPDTMPVPSSDSLRGLALVVKCLVYGGDFAGRPMLFRRRTDREVQYELRLCAHRKPVASGDSAHLACRLEAAVCRGLSQALFGNIRFARRTSPGYCVDELFLPGRS